jgi:hypothetical protein
MAGCVEKCFEAILRIWRTFGGDCEIPGFSRGAVYIFARLECYMRLMLVCERRFGTV